MRFIERMKQGIRSWLDVQKATPSHIYLTETLDYEANAIRNRIWYRGDSSELSQLYHQILSEVDKTKFWASNSSPGMEIRKLHTGLPSLMIDIMAVVALADIGEFTFKKNTDKELWQQIEKDNQFIKGLERAVKECLYIGDGAFKVTFDTAITNNPIIEFYPGDKIDIVYERGRIKEIIFKTVYKENSYTNYTLQETYGYGYIKYKLFKGLEEIDVNSISQTKNLKDIWFSNYRENENGEIVKKGEYMMAVPLKFFESGKWDGRGQSVFDKKIDNFDALDEVWSQWMDALRAGRSKEYIPESLLPRNPNTGEIFKPNPFDNRFIAIGDDMSESAKMCIDLKQPAIPHDSYLATYITALDLCLQGFISPSTMGIDVKKLDNAEAQREKEKATLYTRNAIVSALEDDLPVLVNVCLKAYNEFYTKEVIEDIECNIDFGEYANPSFESVIETVAKAKTGGVMSIEASVEELYGDSKDEEWKKEEIMRLKSEQGIEALEEPSVNLDGVIIDES